MITPLVKPLYELMDLDFPVIVRLARYVVQNELGLDRNVTDSEIAALQCAWNSIDYKEFEKDSIKFTHKYSNCYRFPDKSKTIQTLISNSSKVLKLFSSVYFNAPEEKLTRHNFRRKITELFEKGILEISDFTDSIDKPDENKTDVLNDKNNHIEVFDEKHIDDTLNIDFTGRENDKNRILNILDKHYITFIHGSSGIGKTTLIRNMMDDFKNNYSVFYTDLRYIKDFTQWGYNIISQSKINHHISEDILAGKLVELLNVSHTLVIIDSINWLNNEIKAFIESYSVQSFSSSHFMLASQKRIQFNVDDNDISYYHLQGLKNKKDIYDFFFSLGLKNTEKWIEMNNFYEGNFREIIYISKFIKDYFDGDVSLYWATESKILSPEIVENFNMIFTPLDKSIFAMFSGENNVISTNIIKALRSDSRTAEIFARINHLSDFKFLIQSRSGPHTSFSIPPLLKIYLIQEGIIDD